MNKEAILFTVVYPQALPYLSDVRKCVLAQTRKDFDVVVVNDGCQKNRIEDCLHDLDVTILEAEGGFSENRIQGINYARSHGYKYILFCDADDTFNPNRYERTIDEFSNSQADIIVCNLNIVDDTLEPIINDYFNKEIPESVYLDAHFIETKNIFGMSNTAIRVNSISKDIQIPETPIVDWYLFTVLLLDGLKARYITEAMVNYRQHSSNMIGITIFDVKDFRRLAGLKNNHYRLLAENGYSKYEQLYQDSKLLQNLSDEEIIKIINIEMMAHPQPLWWQIITK